MTLKLHHLRPAPGAKKAKTRKGRGEASKGKTAGRGGKGTHARNTVRPGFEGGQLPLVMRLPKLRGFKNPARIEYQAVNVATINDLFPKGGEVTVADLIAKGAVRAGFLKPRSLGKRITNGSWPPSKPGRTVLRACVPLPPRPAVLPFDASPRPLRVLAFFAPGAGRR